MAYRRLNAQVWKIYELFKKIKMVKVVKKKQANLIHISFTVTEENDFRDPLGRWLRNKRGWWLNRGSLNTSLTVVLFLISYNLLANFSKSASADKFGRHIIDVSHSDAGDCKLLNWKSSAIDIIQDRGAAESIIHLNLHISSYLSGIIYGVRMSDLIRTP